MFSPRFTLYLITIFFIGIWGLLKYPKLSKPFKLLTQLIFCSFITEASTRIVAHIFGQTYPIYHVYIFISLVYYSLIYRSILPRTVFTSVVILAYLCVVTVIEGVTIWQEHGLYFFPSLGLLSTSIFVIILGLLLYGGMLRFPKTTSIFKQGVFWFNSGTIFFYSITFFVFGYFKHFMDSSKSMPNWCYELIWVSNLVLQACYFLAIFFDSKFRETTHEPR